MPSPTKPFLMGAYRSFHELIFVALIYQPAIVHSPANHRHPWASKPLVARICWHTRVGWRVAGCTRNTHRRAKHSGVSYSKCDRQNE